MNSYTVIYHGPSVDEDPEAARRIAEEVATHSSFSTKEVLARLAQTPFAFASGMTGEAAQRHKLFLESLGARVEVQSVQYRRWTWNSGEVKPAAPPRRWFLHGAGRGIFSALASGLLISSMIAIAGFALMLLAPLLAGPGVPFRLLSAVGWSAVALGLFALIAAAILRLPALVSIVKPPDLSTPLQALQSYLRAINDRHWEKALRCLAGRQGSSDLGARPMTEVSAYLRDLSRRVVLPRSIETTCVTLLQEGEGSAVLSFQMEVLSRAPAADGSHQRRVISEAKRFLFSGGSWFLLDGYLMGQRDPQRLPAPGCPECGAELEPGVGDCPSCEASFPTAAVIEEEWRPPSRRPELAAVLSAVMPGLGQAYNGQTLKGLLIAATFWTLLPWVAGVIDALRTAERINRNESFHDLPRRPALTVLLHLGVFALAAALLFANADRLPMVSALLGGGREEAAQTVDPLFRAPGDRFTLLLPRGWSIEETQEKESRFAARAASEDGQSSVMITARKLPRRWQPCPQARAAGERLRAKGAEVVHTECGLIDGRLRYRVDSYSPDRSWRRSLIAVAVRGELLVISFACPASRQEELVPIFEQMVSSLEFQTAEGGD